ncbi:sugar phosphate isomerase/epimerase [Sphingobium sp. JS3065]|uniref:TIM barrel protein n=1 Tax=Sphingobium sp. JS3065 TaxID=2970925 RepID=UPI002264B0BD|nr:TIM barrel protein [Sphingobium sp. JS3065]UZW57458.1 sugar phosphate isomerase/epimerase [Sphingobium sp. JS3065]
MSNDLSLRFAPHLGYITQTEPLFRQSVGTINPADHIAFAAQQGFAGIFDPWMISRPEAEIEDLISALRQHDLESGGITYAPFDVMFTALFARDGRSAWTEIERNLDRSIALANRVGSKTVEVVLQGTPDLPWLEQEKAAAEHMRRAGDRAAAAGLVIGIEHMIALPNLLLRTTEAAVSFLEKTGHPAVRLIFDTGHVQDMDGDIHAAWELARDYVSTVQLADMPGRIAPGTGTLDLVRFLAQAVRDGKADGLIELEHGWTEASAAAEHSGIAALRRMEVEVGLALESADTK